jgi:hypothetical protein
MPKDDQLVMFPVRKRAPKAEKGRDHWKELHDRMTSGPALESEQSADSSVVSSSSYGAGSMSFMPKFLKCLLGAGVSLAGLGLVIFSLFQWNAGHQLIAGPVFFLSFCIIYSGSQIINAAERQNAGW